MSEFQRALDQVQDLHESKSQDYGTRREAFQNVIDGANFAGIEPWVAAMIRANDKMGRLSKTAQGGSQLHDSALDDFLDIATYALIGYCLYNRQPEWPESDPIVVKMQDLSPAQSAWEKIATEGWPEPVSDD
jgi:hypothetical protein